MIKKLSALKNNQYFQDYFWGYVLIFPMIAGLGVFYLGAFFQNIFYSFTDLGAFGNYSFIGLDNYRRLLNDPEIFQTLKNTFTYVIFVVPISVMLSIIIATLLNNKIKGIAFYRVIYFIPAITMPTAAAVVFRWLFNGRLGLINHLLSKIGIDGPNWVSDPQYAMFSLIVLAVWLSVGFNMIIFLAGLQGIPKTYYEAASIEGAGPLTKFFKITLPILSPTVFFMLIMSMINAFQVFSLVLMLISKQSMAIDSTKTIVYVFYRYAFEWHDKGYAAAIAVLIFAIIFVITVIQLIAQKKWVHYD